MRGREIVIDIGNAPQGELLAFYRTQFPSTAGWQQGAADPDVGGSHLLCLVNHSDTRFDEYVEIYAHQHGFTSAAPHRYLVSISRLDAADRSERTVNQCGLASIWYPTDL